MKPLNLIGFLLIAILMSPDTFAHCKGKHADNPPAGHCDGGGSGGTDEAVFHVDIEGVLTGDQDSRPQAIKTGSKSVIFSPRQDFPMAFGLSPFWATQTYAGGASGAECFGGLGVVNGSLHLNETEGSQIGIVAFWFKGNDTDPATDTEIKYVIEFHDSDFNLGWDSGSYDYEFPPGANPLLLNPTGWEMRTEGKGELKKGPCVGAGTFSLSGDDFVEFTLYRK